MLTTKTLRSRLSAEIAGLIRQAEQDEVELDQEIVFTYSPSGSYPDEKHSIFAYECRSGEAVSHHFNSVREHITTCFADLEGCLTVEELELLLYEMRNAASAETQGRKSEEA